MAHSSTLLWIHFLISLVYVRALKGCITSLFNAMFYCDINRMVLMYFDGELSEDCKMMYEPLYKGTSL